MSQLQAIPVPIPFYSQRTDQSLNNADGFRSSEDAAYWQDRGCGIACLRMVIDGLRRSRGLGDGPGYGAVVYKGLEIDAYSERGWIHAGLVRLASVYGVEGKAMRSVGLQQLEAELRANRPCIASVTTCFRGGILRPDGSKRKPGGHLAVVLGCERDEHDNVTAFLVNHPSSATEYNWEHQIIPAERFERSFSGGLMSFWNQEATKASGIWSFFKR